MGTRTIRVGLIGCGVVGQGILRLLQDNATTIEGRLGAPIEVRRIVARSPEKARDAAVPAELLSFDAEDVLGDPEVAARSPSSSLPPVSAT